MSLIILITGFVIEYIVSNRMYIPSFVHTYVSTTIIQRFRQNSVLITVFAWEYIFSMRISRSLTRYSVSNYGCLNVIYTFLRIRAKYRVKKEGHNKNVAHKTYY